MKAVQYSLAAATLLLSLLGRAQVWADVRPSDGSTAGQFGAIVLDESFDSLPFDAAIEYFRDLVPLTPAAFAALQQAAQEKAFTIAAGATEQIVSDVHDLLEQALTDGLSLSDFQRQAADLLARAGITPRAPWYWETVYRTNLQTAYQVGRWKQMTDPAVAAARPYLRYVSALLATTRPSHAEKHGLVYSIDHPFWKSWYPPNGFNCHCTVMSVSQDLLDRRGWTLQTDENFKFPEPDAGFDSNPGETEEV